MDIKIYIVDDDGTLEEFMPVLAKRCIPSREDYTEPLDMEKLKKKKKGKEYIEKLLRGIKI
jgi:hypothetical protein